MNGQAWQALISLPAWSIVQIPRHPATPDGCPAEGGWRDRGIAQRLQALTAAFHRGAPVAFGWVRSEQAGPVRVIAAGPGLAGSYDSRHAVLTLPSGARAASLAPGGAAELFAGIPHWRALAGITDALLADADQPRDTAEPRPSLEDGLLTAWSGPFGWLVLAEPVSVGALSEMVGQVAFAQLGAQRYDSPEAQLAVRRATGRHAELSRAGTTGLWAVRVLAGGAVPESAAQLAGLLCASADLDGLPYALVPSGGHGSLPEVLSGAIPGEQLMRNGGYGHPDRSAPRHAQAPGTLAHGPAPPYLSQPAPGLPSAAADEPVARFPFHGSSRLLAALARPPAREVPGVRFVLRPDFDVTPETASIQVSEPAVALGTVLDWNRVPAGTLSVPQSSLNRHVFTCGATGAGKSQTVRHLLESATHVGIPWLVIEPAKAEYRLMAARLPGAEVIALRPGDLDAPPAGINLLEPATGPGGDRFPLQAHADLVRALFLASFDADEPFPQVLAAALTRCYEQAGWDLVTGEPACPGARPAYPVLADLQAAALAMVEDIGYGREVTDNVRGFVTVRIGSLRLGTTGRFLEGGHQLDFARLLDANVVLEIEDAGDDRDKAFLIGAVLIRLIEHLRMRQRAEGPASPRLRHLTVVEEAHRLLRQPPPGAASGPAAHAVEMFAGLLAEIRAYGEGLIIAEQIPAKLVPDVIKNTAVKIVHRLPAADDRAAVGATMNLTDQQSQYLVTLVPGEAAVFTDGMDYSLLVRMPDGTGRETTQTAALASPAALIAPRSTSCGSACQQAPCTLRQMRAAERAAADDPRITLWAELAVLAHVAGWPAPLPAGEFGVPLEGLTDRQLDCVIAHVTDAAVRSRATAVTSRVDPQALAAHVVGSLRSWLAGEPGCPREEPQWLAPACAWDLIAEELAKAVGDGSGMSRHPRSSQWEHDTGRVIPGRDCAVQLMAVQAWQQQAWADAGRRSITVFGAGRPSAIEKAVGSRTADPAWREELSACLAGAFTRARWTLNYLAPRVSAAGRTKPAGDAR